MSHVGERLLQGRNNWWFLGPGGVARLGPQHLTDEGALRSQTRGALLKRGLLTAATGRTYSLTVLTSTDCNLGCGYCFQNTGQDRSGCWGADRTGVRRAGVPARSPPSHRAIP